MSFKVVSWVLEHSNAKGNDRMALLIFAEKADPDGSDAFPSADRIAYEGRMARSTAIEARKRLVAEGRLIPDGEDPWGKGIPNFRVRMDVAAEGPPPKLPVRDKGGGRLYDPHASEGGPASEAGGSESPELGGPIPGPEPPMEPSSQPILSPPVGPPVDPFVTQPVEAIWEHYVKVMAPRSKKLDPEGRKIINAALKVATAAECVGAITACSRSDFHMRRGQYAGRSGPKFNKLTHILKGKRGGKTTREQIDMFLDMLEEGDRARVDNWGRARADYDRAAGHA